MIRNDRSKPSWEWEIYAKGNVQIWVHERKNGEVYYAKYLSSGEAGLGRMAEASFDNEVTTARRLAYHEAMAVNWPEPRAVWA